MPGGFGDYETIALVEGYASTQIGKREGGPAVAAVGGSEQL
jgi:hypothetical protein